MKDSSHRARMAARLSSLVSQDPETNLPGSLAPEERLPYGIGDNAIRARSLTMENGVANCGRCP